MINEDTKSSSDEDDLVTVSFIGRIIGVAEKIHRDERGATATEMVVLIVLVAAFIIASVALFGERIEGLYRAAVDTLYRDVRID